MAPSGVGFVSKSHDPEGPCVHLHQSPVQPTDLGTTETAEIATDPNPANWTLEGGHRETLNWRVIGMGDIILEPQDLYLQISGRRARWVRWKPDLHLFVRG